jgi:hypothetical protein
MTRAAGVLRSVYEPEDGSTRGSWRHNEQRCDVGYGPYGAGIMHTVYAAYGKYNTNFPRFPSRQLYKANHSFGEDPLLASLRSLSFLLGTIVSLFYTER